MITYKYTNSFNLLFAMEVLMEYSQALIGGALIGFSAVLLLALNGRVAGISDIFAGIFSNAGAERS